MRRALAFLYCLFLLGVGVGVAYFALKHGIETWPTEGNLRDKALAGGLIGLEVLGAWAVTLLVGFVTAKAMFAAVIKTIRRIFMTIWAAFLFSGLLAIIGSGYAFGQSRASGMLGAGACVILIVLWWGGLALLGYLFPDHKRPILDDQGFITGHA